MIVTKKAIRRRTVLRGIGTTLALPLLDCMVPAMTASANTPAAPINRFGVVYVPNGMVMEHWTPAAEGTAFDLPATLQPLARFRSQMHILTGLQNKGVGIHENGSTRFLTGVAPRSTQGSDLHAGVSADQLAARELGKQTQLASLELSLEVGESTGTCGTGFSCAYTNTLSWRTPTTPLPVEDNPRIVFERLFGDSSSTTAASRQALNRETQSVIDGVLSKVARLQRAVGARDRAKLDEYLEAVRDVERRVQKAEQQSAAELPRMDRPAGIPDTFEGHAKLMFDLQVLAYQCDLTRVITFMLGREFSGRTYPQLGITDPHHPLSHHQNKPESLDKLAKIQAYHAGVFAYYLDRLQSTPDGDGSLLDHLMLIYGGGLSDSQTHSAEDLPIVLFGGGAGTLKGGRHTKYPGTTPMPNLHVALLQKLGLPIERLGDSSGALGGLNG
jgi:hypothetical protein